MNDTANQNDIRREGPLGFSFVNDTRGFRLLEARWDELYDACDSTPFQSWAWLYSWWEFFGEGDFDLHLVVVHPENEREGSAVAILPLMLARSRSMNRLLIVGNGPTSYLDFLVRPGFEQAVSQMMDEILAAIPDWHVADLQQLRRGAVAHEIVAGFSGRKQEMPHDDCLVLDAMSWEEMISHLRKSQRTQSRKTIRRVEQDGLRHRQVPQEETEGAARTLVDLNRRYWLKSWQRTAPEHWEDAFEKHIVAVSGRLSRKGIGAISELRDGEGGVVLSQLLLFGRDFTLDYIVAPDPTTLKRYSFNTLFIYFAMKVARERGSMSLGLMRGSEEYKWRWSPTVHSNTRVILGRDAGRWLAYTTRCTLNAKLSGYARAEATPGWLRGFLDRGEERHLAKRWRSSPKHLVQRLERSAKEIE